MTKEEQFVVNPLENYFLDHERSGAKWKIKDKPKHGKSETGWDLQVERKNLVLLIEAKYIAGPFASAFAGLTLAPLINRPEKMKRKLYRGWCATICWAIGCGGGYNLSRVYQILFDYFARNLEFWRCYSKTLRVKYIFFIDNDLVATMGFSKIIDLSGQYRSFLGRPLSERRIEAKRLLEHLDFK